MRNPDPWDVVEPERMLTDVFRELPREPDDVLVSMMRTGDDQQLMDVKRVHTGALPERHDASALLRDHARSTAGERPWVGPGWQPLEFVFVTIVCREGRVVPTAQDYFWLLAWRYSNHISNAYDGDVYLVTEHGWTGCIDQRAGFEPRLGGAGNGPRQLELVRPQ
jgi:hypothetical protein